VTFAFAAAGSGGHVFPALAVADALLDAGVDRGDVVFFGGDRMEAETIPAAGYDFVRVDIKGLRRSLSAENLKLPGLVRRAARVIRNELERRSVRSVGVFGGYVSVPAAMAARRSGAALIVHEQNARPGLANRLIAPRATSTLVGFAEALTRLKRARVVGNPLRSSIARFSRDGLAAAARDRYGLPTGIPVLGVLGGSLGAQVLNEITVRIAADAEPGSFGIVQLTGPTHLESLEAVGERAPIPWAMRAFESDMEYFYAIADVVLARAGALTVSELMATGTPAVLVPLEATHQAENTRALEEAGGALVVPQSDLERVPIELQQLILDTSRRRQMAESSRRLATPDAAREVARELMEAADGR
jgi:UDP-N-acetylglucosamine--N-acetylmuramyl-(pentapeptide) pyrophosphoryl-undecaprenol N-acetylglucosamine transferase